MGNLYVNRNMVGAVVGALTIRRRFKARTGPAGGPLYLYRLLANRPENALGTTLARQDADYPVDAQLKAALVQPLEALSEWATDCPHCARSASSLANWRRPERNACCQAPPASAIPGRCCRVNALCIADDEQDALVQVAAVTSVGSF